MSLSVPAILMLALFAPLIVLIGQSVIRRIRFRRKRAALAL
jgi:hypothetical protein